MQQSLLIRAATLASAILVGCGDWQTGAEPNHAGPSFRTARNPDGPGALVLRYGYGIGLAEVIPNTEFNYLIGFTPEEIAEGCEQGEFPSAAQGDMFEQQVFRPDGSVKEVLRVKKVPLIVWNVGTDEFCSAPPFAVGTAEVTNTDNDQVFGGPQRTNSFDFRIRGTVTALEGGQRYRLWRRVHYTILKSREIRVASEEWKFFPIGS